ncbi:hypothetical protein JB92DRAFT_2833444 [Gautieria morchelliformis]|nr:hypothetical protein JB92DRAFT_2833444 [Gautieria morchelliformis]
MWLQERQRYNPRVLGSGYCMKRATSDVLGSGSSPKPGLARPKPALSHQMGQASNLRKPGPWALLDIYAPSAATAKRLAVAKLPSAPSSESIDKSAMEESSGTPQIGDTP